ncbi:MAG: DUF1800 domain-containing protein, partial [Vicinamibacteria bacterium]|nr:DUF1800 domain-containing protein [Vicinamibacteria bacterium]
ELESRLAPFNNTLKLTTTQVLVTYADSGNQTSSIQAYLDNLYNAKLVRSVHSRNQLEEALADFWFNHFNVNINDGFVRYSIQSYERDAIRPNALGKFETLLRATAEHPAMLYYLDNYLSQAGRTVNGVLISGLNENYGREILELHTVGVDAGYTQSDVYEAARAFTGWGIDNVGRGGNFLYSAARHDTGSKSIFGLQLAAGGGKDDGDRLIRYLATHPSTARFVSTKLARRFASDNPPATLVDRMAEAWLATEGDIREVMKAMIGSAEFWAEAFSPGKPRTPFEYVVGSIRAIGGEVSSATRSVVGYLSQMGQPLYQCIPPTGYADSGAEWLNPSSQVYRMNFALDLAQGLINGVAVNVRNYAVGADLTNPASVARAANTAVYGGTLLASTVDAAGRVDSRIASPSSAVRVSALLLASPDTQVR